MLTLLAIALLGSAFAPSFGQEPDKQSEKARENLKEAKEEVVEAKQELKEAKRDSIAEFNEFKKESELKIKENDKSIADLKIKISKMNAKDKADNQKKISALEEKNTKLKYRLNNYKIEEKGKWTSFKSEFNHDMSELGNALKDFGTDNKK